MVFYAWAGKCECCGKELSEDSICEVYLDESDEYKLFCLSCNQKLYGKHTDSKIQLTKNDIKGFY